MRTSPITVVIPTYHRSDQLLATLDQIYQCNPAPREVIVHIDANDDVTRAALDNSVFKAIKIIQSDTQMGPGGGRNRAIAIASHELIASFDDDSYPMDPDYFSRLMQLFNLFPNAAVIGASIFHIGETILPDSLVAKWVPDFIGCGCAYRKSAFQQTKGYVPCDLSSFSQQIPDRPRNPITILFCGQMISRKGVDILLKAFQRLLDDGYHARLLLVGREADLPQMLKPLPDRIKQHIKFAGFQAPDDLPHFFRKADIFVLPSRYDGWGVVVNQALGAGLPIICSDAVGAAQDLIESGANGFIVPSGDAEILFSVLKRFFDDPDQICMASQVSLQKASMWSPAVGAKHWLDVLQTVTV